MTIISNSSQFIFLHLHKCGGSSVEVAYQPHAKWNDLVIGSSGEGEKIQPIYKRLHGLHKHNSAMELRHVVGDVWDQHWTFSLVRHPLSIYESFFRWTHKIFSNYAKRHGLSLEDLKQQITAGESDAPFKDYDVTLPFVQAEDFSEFVLRFLPGCETGTLFDRLGDGEQVIVDDVFKLEENDRLWAALSARTGIQISPAWDNKGADLRDLRWSDESCQQVHDKHAIDYEMFGYAPARAE